jgi:hypothetical protein
VLVATTGWRLLDIHGEEHEVVVGVRRLHDLIAENTLAA